MEFKIRLYNDNANLLCTSIYCFGIKSVNAARKLINNHIALENINVLPIDISKYDFNKRGVSVFSQVVLPVCEEQITRINKFVNSSKIQIRLSDDDHLNMYLYATYMQKVSGKMIIQTELDYYQIVEDWIKAGCPQRWVLKATDKTSRCIEKEKSNDDFAQHAKEALETTSEYNKTLENKINSTVINNNDQL